MTAVVPAVSSSRSSSVRPQLAPNGILEAAQHDVAAISIATVYRNIKALLDAGEI